MRRRSKPQLNPVSEEILRLLEEKPMTRLSLFLAIRSFVPPEEAVRQYWRRCGKTRPQAQTMAERVESGAKIVLTHRLQTLQRTGEVRREGGLIFRTNVRYERSTEKLPYDEVRAFLAENGPVKFWKVVGRLRELVSEEKALEAWRSNYVVKRKVDPNPASGYTRIARAMLRNMARCGIARRRSANTWDLAERESALTLENEPVRRRRKAPVEPAEEFPYPFDELLVFLASSGPASFGTILSKVRNVVPEEKAIKMWQKDRKQEETPYSLEGVYNAESGYVRITAEMLRRMIMRGSVRRDGDLWMLRDPPMQETKAG